MAIKREFLPSGVKEFSYAFSYWLALYKYHFCVNRGEQNVKFPNQAKMEEYPTITETKIKTRKNGLAARNLL